MTIDTLSGAMSNDSLTGAMSNDTLRGSSGNDLLLGGLGNDMFYISAGQDTIEGGVQMRWPWIPTTWGDADTLDASGFGSLTIDLSARTITLPGSIGLTHYIGIENLYGSDQSDHISGRLSESPATGEGSGLFLYMRGGSDVLRFLPLSSPAPWMDGPNVSYGWSQTGVHLAFDSDGHTAQVSYGAANNQVAGTDIIDYFSAISDSPYDDFFDLTQQRYNALGYTTNSETDVSYFSVLYYRGGNDTVLGNGDTNLFFASINGTNDGNGVYADLTSGRVDLTNLTFNSYALGSVSFSNVRGLIGTNFDDVLLGGVNDKFETFRGMGGNDYIDGRSGFDRADYRVSTEGIIVHLAQGLVHSPSQGVDTLRSIEEIVGSNFDDEFDATGYSGDLLSQNLNISSYWYGLNSFQPLGGNDVIVGNGASRLSYEGAMVGVIIDLATGVADALNPLDKLLPAYQTVGHDVFTGVVEARGTAYADLLLGGGIGRTITGLPVEIFMGYAGDDTIDGGNGWDIVQYFSSPNAIQVDLRNNSAQVQDGWGFVDTLRNIEEITGSNYNDWMMGDGSNNTFQPYMGNDTIDGGTGGHDELNYSNSYGSVRVLLNGWAALAGSLPVGYTGSTLKPDGEIDVFRNIDGIEGSAYDDLIVGNSDANWLDGRGGNDTLDGGSGIDWAEYNQAVMQGVYVDLQVGFARDGLGGQDSLLNIENAVGGYANDTLIGSSGDNWLKGEAGADLLIGGLGNDTLDGGIFTDRKFGSDRNTVSYTNSTSGIELDLRGIEGDGGQGQGVVRDGLGGIDLIRNASFFIGSAFNDTMIGSNAFVNEEFEGGFGNDTVDGGVISDRYGAFAHNRVSYRSATGAVNVDLGSGLSTGADGQDVLTRINAVWGSNYGDNLIGSDATAYNEHFFSSPGNDTIDGRGGRDFLRYDYRTGPVIVDLSRGLTIDDGFGGTDTLLNIEGVFGSDYDDLIIGNQALNGTGLVDGFEFFRGNAGNDTIDGGAGWDVADYSAANFGVEVALGASRDGYAQDGQGGIDTLRGIEAVRGSAHNDLLHSSGRYTYWTDGYFESFEGLEGNDTLDGSAGSGALRADYFNSIAGVRVDLKLGFANDGFGGVDSLINVGGVRGSLHDDVLIGNAGRNVLSGEAGNDLVKGGGKNDTLDGGGGFDTARFEGLRSDYDIVVIRDGLINVNDRLSDRDGNDVLMSIEALEFSDQTIQINTLSPTKTIYGTVHAQLAYSGSTPVIFEIWSQRSDVAFQPIWNEGKSIIGQSSVRLGDYSNSNIHFDIAEGAVIENASLSIDVQGWIEPWLGFWFDYTLTGTEFIITDSGAGSNISSSQVTVTANSGPPYLTDALNSLPVGGVSLSGIPAVSGSLHASHNISDDEGVFNVTYQWVWGLESDTTLIDGATSSDLIVPAGSENKWISVWVQYTDSEGSVSRLRSELVMGTSDDQAPTVLNFTPADDATGVGVGSNIVLTFSESVQKGAGNIVISNGTDTRTIAVGDAQITVSGSTVTINPTADLQANSTYNVQLASGVINDLAGNSYAGISNATTLNFSTAETTPPILQSLTASKSTLLEDETSLITITLAEPSLGFGLGNITVSGGTLSNFQASGATYTAVFTPISGRVLDASIRVDGVAVLTPAVIGYSPPNEITLSVWPSELKLGALAGVGLNLLHPIVLPNGKVYYVIDSNDQQPVDDLQHDVLDTLFNNGNDRTNTQPNGAVAGVDDARTLIVGPYTLVNPTTTEITALRQAINFALPDGWRDANIASATLVSTNVHHNVAFTNTAIYTNLYDGYGYGGLLVVQALKQSTNNHTPTGGVTISGLLRQGQVLTSNNTLADTDGIGTIAYQWQAGGVNISGATSNSYTLTQAEVGKTITVIANYVDRLGNAESAISAASVAVAGVADIQAPTVVITDDEAGTGNIAGGNITYTFTFSESVTGFEAQDVAVVNGVKGLFTAVSSTVYTLVVTPTAGYEGNVTVDVAGGKAVDTQSNSNTAATQSVQAVDMKAPTVVNFSPADNATAVAVGSNIVLTFSEAVQKGTGNIVISNGTDTRNIAVGDAQITLSGSTVTINPTAELQANSTYNVQLASGVINDLAGNSYAGISNTTTLNFVTESINPSLGLQGIAYDWKSHMLLSGVSVRVTDSKAVNATPADAFDLRGANFDAVTGKLSVQVWANSASAIDSLDFNASSDQATTVTFTSSLGSGWTPLTNITGGSITLGAYYFDANNPNSLGVSGSIQLGTLEFTLVSGATSAQVSFSQIQLGGTQPADQTLAMAAQTTGSNGNYNFSSLPAGTYGLSTSRSAGDGTNGVTAADALAALKIAVGINPNPDPDGAGPLTATLLSPYQIIASDANKDGKVTAADALAILKMAVGLGSAPAKEWLFVQENQDFWDEVNMVFTLNKNNASWDNTLDATLPQDAITNLVGVYKGDVNGSWTAPAGSLDLDILDPAHFQTLATLIGVPLEQWHV
jgi:Ca2+-binding RTX toxin-like protein/methionine-rich copper-binding protein CopC